MFHNLNNEIIKGVRMYKSIYIILWKLDLKALSIKYVQ